MNGIRERARLKKRIEFSKPRAAATKSLSKSHYITPRGSFLKQSNNARNFENGQQQKYPNLDFDWNRPNTGIRLSTGVPSYLNNSPNRLGICGPIS